METFEQFMARCLHHPEKGYYSRNIRGIGARGDFTTAPQLSTAPASAIAAWATKALRETSCRNLIEIGPGLGTLANDVFRRLPLTLRLKTKLHLVESSATLAAHQKNLLKNRAQHHSDIHSALQVCEGNAVIFSNELVDAFPVRLFEKHAEEWLEIAIDRSGEILNERLLPAATLPPSSVFGRDFPDGQRVEIHDSYRLWIESWMPLWTRGEMLTIDYGDSVDSLYHRQPKGTLRAYLLHQRLEGTAVYQNSGLQDITADVNFTDLCDWASSWCGRGVIKNFADFIRPFATKTEPGLLEAASYFKTIRQRRNSEAT